MRIRLLALVTFSFLFLASCSPAVETDPAPASEAAQTPIRLPTPTPLPRVVVPRFNMENTRRIPDFFGLLSFDSIYPVYAPEFVNAVDAPLQDDELVLGIAWDGEAKAYPISVLRFREIVNDELAGLPILVTW